MRLLHTADWHLGHTLHGVSREYEHRCFLAWLLDLLREQRADALLVAGDVFDSANPPASAQAMFYQFIAEARRRCPRLDIVVVGGNHDSPARLEAPQPLLDSLGARVIGALPRIASGELDFDRLLVPLHDRAGEIAAWCAAVPFLRPADLPRDAAAESADDPLITGVRQVYHQVLAAAKARLSGSQALVATGHCYLVGTQLSELSERKILGGNQHALPADLFPADLAYVALGHLHLAQAVGGREHIRYSGSPIPLSLTEDRYPHQVVQADLGDGRDVVLNPLRVPRAVDVWRLPKEGPRPPDEVMALLESLAMADDMPLERQPLLEVSVLLERPEPGLRQRIEESLRGKPVRLLKISTHYPGTSGSLADVVPEIQLEELAPDEVFTRLHRQKFETEPSADLLAAFHELLEAQQGERR